MDVPTVSDVIATLRRDWAPGPWTLRPAWAGFALVVAALVVLVRACRRARDVPFSPLTARRRVGADYPERLGVAGAPVAGEMDDLGAYAGPDFDPDAVAEEVRRFYERTTDHEMTYRARWHRGFRTGAALAARLTRRMEQLNLPGPGGDAGRLRSRIVALDPGADPRDGARAWVRTDPRTGEAVFVALYAAHERDGEHYVNIAAPLPWSNLSTVLALRNLPLGGTGGTGVELTTRAPDDPGLYLVTPLGALSLPLAQRFRVAPAGRRGAPDVSIARPDATLLASHEMWVCGRQFLTVEYAVAPAGASRSAGDNR